MAVTISTYGKLWDHIFQKRIDIDSDSIKVALLTSSYTPDLDAHDYFDDVTSYQVTATGYTSGGVALGSVSWTYDSGTNTYTFDAADPSWTITGSCTARYAVVYDSTPATDATRPLMFLINLGEDKTATDGTFKLTLNASGLFTAT